MQFFFLDHSIDCCQSQPASSTMMFVSLALLLAAAALARADDDVSTDVVACSVGTREGVCLDATSCGTLSGMRAYGLDEPSVNGASCNAANIDSAVCCAPAVYGGCQATWGATVRTKKKKKKQKKKKKKKKKPLKTKDFFFFFFFFITSG
jgi:hypothetical protein